MATSVPAGKAHNSFDVLPPELRSVIYRLLLGDRVFHIAHGPRLEWVCYIGEKVDEDNRIIDIKAQRGTVHEFASYTHHHRSCFGDQPQAPRPSLSILLVSHMVHQEAIQVFHGSNEFHFEWVFGLYHFLKHSPLTQLALLRHITLVIDMDSLYSGLAAGALPIFFKGGTKRAAFETAVTALKGLKTLRLILEISDPALDFPRSDLVELLGAISRLLPGRKTACIYPTKTAQEAIRSISKEDMVVIEQQAIGDKAESA